MGKRPSSHTWRIVLSPDSPCGRPVSHAPQLEAIQAQATHELDKLDFDVGVSTSVQNNRVEVYMSDRAWFEGELRRVGARLPDGAELVVVEGGSTARNKDLLLTPPVPGIAFPRQKPTEGFRESMMAELVGTLRLEGACLYVQSLGGEVVLPIWPPDFTLRLQGDRVHEEQALVIDGKGQVAARAGEEVYMDGGYVGVTDEWVLQQIPPACRGEYFVVGNEVRPNLRYDSDLFALDVDSTTERTVLFLRYKPALDAQVANAGSIAGKLVVYDYNRCLHLPVRLGTGRGRSPLAIRLVGARQRRRGRSLGWDGASRGSGGRRDPPSRASSATGYRGYTLPRTHRRAAR